MMQHKSGRVDALLPVEDALPVLISFDVGEAQAKILWVKKIDE